MISNLSRIARYMAILLFTSGIMIVACSLLCGYGLEATRRVMMIFRIL